MKFVLPFILIIDADRFKKILVFSKKIKLFCTFSMFADDFSQANFISL